MHEKFLNCVKKLFVQREKPGRARARKRETHKITPGGFGILWRLVAKCKRRDVAKQKQNHKIAHKIS